MPDKKKILITAANGFGPHIISAFQEAGYEVMAIARNEERAAAALVANPSLSHDNIIIQDLTAPDTRKAEFWKELLETNQIDGVVNNAMVTPKNSLTKPTDEDQSRTWKVNERAARGIFEACADIDIPVIQQSTHNTHILNDENDHYRKSKDAAREIMQQYVEKEDLRAVELQPGMMTTPGSGHYRLELLAAMPVDMKPLGGKAIMQPGHILDATDAMVGMMENLLEERYDCITLGAVYKAAGAEAMPLPEYINKIREAMGIDNRPTIPLPIPQKLSEAVMHFNSQLPVQVFGPFDKFDMQELQRDFTVTEQELSDFMRAGNLTELRDPIAVYTDYARENTPYGPIGAILANSGLDAERWLREWRPEDAEKLHKRHQSRLPSLHDEQRIGNLKTANIAEAREQPERKKILVTGATGFMGPTIVEELVAAGHEVVCAVRNIDKAKMQLPYPHIEFMNVDFNADTDPAIWEQRLREHNIQGIVNNVGIANAFGKQSLENVNTNTPMALFHACEAMDRERENSDPMRVVQVSTTGVSWEDCDKYEYPKTKRETERQLQQLEELDYIIVRPNVVYEPGRGHIPIEEIAKFPVIPCVGDSEIQPIHNRDLALGIARLMEPGNQAHREVLDATGPNTMTWEDVFRDTREAIGHFNTIIPKVPLTLAQQAASLNQSLPDSLLQHMGTLSKIDPETIDMMTKGSVQDNSRWVEATAVRPTTVYEAYWAHHQGREAYRDLCDSLRETEYFGPCTRTSADEAIRAPGGVKLATLKDSAPHHLLEGMVDATTSKFPGLCQVSRALNALEKNSDHVVTTHVTYNALKMLRNILPDAHDPLDRKLLMRDEDSRIGRGRGSVPLDEVSEFSFSKLFPKGEEHTWPTQLVLIANDPLGEERNLSYYLAATKKMVNQLTNTSKDYIRSVDELESDDIAGQIVIVGKHYNFGNIGMNGTMLAERHITDEPRLIPSADDLALSVLDILIDVEETVAHMMQENTEIVIREDAGRILDRIMASGFSQGGQIATDMYRILGDILIDNNFRISDGDGSYQHANQESVAEMFSHSVILAMADMDKPYTEEELAFMPPRIRIFNHNDFFTHAAGVDEGKNTHEKDKTLFLETSAPTPGDLMGHAPSLYFDTSITQHMETLKADIGSRFDSAAEYIEVAGLRTDGNNVLIYFDRLIPPSVIEEKAALLIENLEPHTTGKAAYQLHGENVLEINLPEEIKAARAVITEELNAIGVITKQRAQLYAMHSAKNDSNLTR